jgi:pimeloyl-ACP methyl ester carboxylesterase
VRSIGQGPAVVLIHPTGTDSRYFDRPAEALAPGRRVMTYDRAGWGESEVAGDYRRTSIAEQAIEAAGLIRARDRDAGETGSEGPITALGVGFGAVVALELALAEPDLIARALLVEPPLLGLLPSATEGVSVDVEAIRASVEQSGPLAAYELFLDGKLTTLGAGAERLGDRADRAPAAAHTFLVELPAVPAWPIDPVRLAGLTALVAVATMPSSPRVLIEAADALTPRIPGAERAVTGADLIDEAIAEMLEP